MVRISSLCPKYQIFHIFKNSLFTSFLTPNFLFEKSNLKSDLTHSSKLRKQQEKHKTESRILVRMPRSTLQTLIDFVTNLSSKLSAQCIRIFQRLSAVIQLRSSYPGVGNPHFNKWEWDNDKQNHYRRSISSLPPGVFPRPGNNGSPGTPCTHSCHILDSALEILIEHYLRINKNSGFRYVYSMWNCCESVWVARDWWA